MSTPNNNKTIEVIDLTGGPAVTPSPRQKNPKKKRKRNRSDAVGKNDDDDDDEKLRATPKAKRQLFVELSPSQKRYATTFLKEGSVHWWILKMLDEHDGKEISRVDLSKLVEAHCGKPIVQANPRGGQPVWVNCKMREVLEEKHSFVGRDRTRLETDAKHNRFFITDYGREALRVASTKVCAKSKESQITQFFTVLKKKPPPSQKVKMPPQAAFSSAWAPQTLGSSDVQLKNPATTGTGPVKRVANPYAKKSPPPSQVPQTPTPKSPSRNAQKMAMANPYRKKPPAVKRLSF